MCYNCRMKSETVSYGGVRWRRYPDSKGVDTRMYFRAFRTGTKKGLESSLHRQIWRDANGPIPKGCHIHHIDGNPLNNHISNLQCVTVKAHRAHHSAEATAEQLKAMRENLERIRPLASQWHKSEAGKEWGKAISVAYWAQRKPVIHVCDHCGESFESLAQTSRIRFCSNRCRLRQYRVDKQK